MKVLERERVVQGKARGLDAPRPVARPSVSVRSRRVAGPARRTAALGALCGRIVAFAAVVGVAYVGRTLAGYVALERARQGARHGEARASFARTEAESVRASIEALTNPGDLRAWADAHGFEAVHRQGSGLVARR